MACWESEDRYIRSLQRRAIETQTPIWVAAQKERPTVLTIAEQRNGTATVGPGAD